MKKIFMLFILTLTLLSLANAQIDNSEIYKKKIQSFSKMKKSGWTMAGIGGAMTAGGIVLVSMADWEHQYSSSGESVTTDDPAGIGGMLFLVGGIPLTVTGIILGSIGSKKYKAYKNKLGNVGLSPLFNKDYQGLTFSYKF